MFRKLFCLLGFHDWETLEVNVPIGGSIAVTCFSKKCSHCSKEIGQ